MVSPQEGKELIIFFQQKQKAAFNLQKQKDMMERAFTGASWLHTHPPPSTHLLFVGLLHWPLSPCARATPGGAGREGGQEGQSRAGASLPLRSPARLPCPSEKEPAPLRLSGPHTGREESPTLIIPATVLGEETRKLGLLPGRPALPECRADMSPRTSRPPFSWGLRAGARV